MHNITFLTEHTNSGLPDAIAPRHALLYAYHLAARRKVVSVSAPAGYGKTVSTLLWLKDSDAKSIWLSLDTYSNTPAQLYHLICMGLARLQPDNTAIGEMLSNPFFAASPVECATAIIDALQVKNESYVLVLDDFHLIADESIHNALPEVLAKLPKGFTVLILSRTALPEQWSRLEADDMLSRISVSELAFSEEEIRKFFAMNNKILSPTEAAHVYALTSGWAIGVTALVKSGEPLFERLAENVLSDYIEARIWDKWDTELKSFLMKASVVDSVSVPLCEILTGRKDSYEVLERLCASNTFLNRLSEDSYRFHHLFLDFLRLKLSASGIDERSLNAAAARYYIEREEYFTAERYALKSGDGDLISDVLQSAAQPIMLPIEELLSFYKFFSDEELPPDICERYPYLYGEQMGYYYYTGNAAKVEYCFDKTYEALPVLFEKFPQFVEKTIYETHLDYRIPLAEQIQALQNMPEIPVAHDILPVFSFTMAYLPFFHRGARDYSELADENIFQTVVAVFGALLRENGEVATETVGSGLLLEQNRLTKALEKANHAKALLGETTGADVAFCVHIHLAEIYAAMGDYDAYRAAIQDTEAFIAEKNALQLMPNFKAYQARYHLQKGNREAAFEWLSNYFVTEMKKPEFYKLYRHFTTTRAYMVLGELDTVLEYTEKIKQLCEDYRRPLDVAEAWTLIAIVYWKLGNREKALDAMGSALRILQPHGFIRVIANEGEAVLPMLKIFRFNAEKKSYNGELESRYIHRVYLAAHEQAKRVSGMLPATDNVTVKLSKQQQKIISLLSQGCANADMIEITGLTLHTIRTHTTGAYKKLGVDNAADAVLKAKLLGIIE